MTRSEALLKHARKFGTEGIAETAVTLGFELNELTDLLAAMDSIEQANTPRIAQRRKTIDLMAVCERRAKKLLGLTDNDDTPLEAA